MAVDWKTRTRISITYIPSGRAFYGACRGRPTLYRAEHHNPKGRAPRSYASQPFQGLCGSETCVPVLDMLHHMGSTSPPPAIMSFVTKHGCASFPGPERSMIESNAGECGSAHNKSFLVFHSSLGFSFNLVRLSFSPCPRVPGRSPQSCSSSCA